MLNNLDGLGFEFDETLSGWASVGVKDFEVGRTRGEAEKTPLRIDVKVTIPDLQRFITISNHSALLVGTVTYEPLGGTFTMRDGVFNLFSVAAGTNERHMTYSFRFTTEDGQTYFFFGFKVLKDDGFDVLHDMTTLYTTIYAGEDENAPVYAAGLIYFHVSDIPSWITTLRVPGATWWGQRVVGKIAFFSFGYGKLRQEYLRGLNPIYDTEYENLVLSGEVMDNGSPRKFFMVSGAHDKDFPWGDGEVFWDVLLAVADGKGDYRKYCITERVLEGMLINVERGTYRYQGPIFELTQGYSTSRTQMHGKAAELVRCEADFTIKFDATAFPTTPMPFMTADNLMARLSYGLREALRKILPSERQFGMHITPYAVTVTEGTLSITGSDGTTGLGIVAEKTYGEAESTTMRSIKEPTLLYGYLCAVNPDKRMARVQLDTNSLRNDREDWLKDKIDAVAGAFISQVGSKEMLLQDGRLTVTDLAPKGENEEGARRFVKIGRPIMEVNNDQFPTATLQRRIVEVLDPSGEKCLALEEDVNPLRIGPINSGREAVVAAIKGDDKLAALEEVLNETGFWQLLDKKFQESQKSKADFLIAIKANFAMAYNKHDRSTFTDPELVERLVALLRDPERGFENIAVVEAQSNYSQDYDNTGIREMAEYLGYDVTGSKGYRVVDLTLDAGESQHLGRYLGYHPVPTTWKNADFRVSFAKNKTHTYAFFTLTIKNIYGALPLAAKFKEYHCDRDVYHTTIEYLTAFPVDYGLIDAYVSADGPFGIFADCEPNDTRTIIGGTDLVAVDWVGATKMGLDPMISKHVKYAVEAFGKPRIIFKGDPNPYRPWLNVPPVVLYLSLYGVDANYHFGNMLYLVNAYMDSSHFHYKPDSEWIKAMHDMLKPLQETLFLQSGGDRSIVNRVLGKLQRKMGE